MAYKFNVGTFNLGGTLDVEASTGADINLPNLSVDNADLAGSINQAKLAGSIPDTKLNQITTSDKVAGSAVQLVTGGGIENDSGLELVMVNDGINAIDFNMTADTLYIGSQGNGGNIRSASIGDFVSRMTGSALAASNGVLSVSGLANAQIDNNAAISLTKLAAVTAGNVVMGNASNQATATAISGDIALANNGAVTLAGTQTNISAIINSSLAIGTAADQEYIDFSNSNEIRIAINNTPQLTVADNSVTIAGNLTVNGTTTSVNSTTLLVEDKTIELNVVTGSEGRTTNSGAGFFISGSSADKEASLLLTADGGKFKASGSAGGGFDVAVGGGYAINGTTLLSATALHANVIVDGDSLNIAGCASSLNSAQIADADLFIVDDNAAGDPKKITAGQLKTFFQEGVSASSASKLKRTVNTYSGGASAQQIISDDSMVDVFNITGAASAVISGSFSQGDQITIKAGPQVSTTVFVNVTGALGSGFRFDGLDGFKLESANASITLVELNGSGSFGIF